MSQPDYTPQDHWEAWANKTAPQPQHKQEPVATKTEQGITLHVGWDDLPTGTKLYQSPQIQEPQEPVYWEWRWFDESPYTVTSGQWSEWKRVQPRSALQTLDDALNEFRAYITKGNRYELRALYTAPQQREWVGLTDEEIRALLILPGGRPRTAIELAYAVEAKLREKNGRAWG